MFLVKEIVEQNIYVGLSYDILESAWFPEKCNKKLILLDVESKLNSFIEKQLDEKMIELQS